MKMERVLSSPDYAPLEWDESGVEHLVFAAGDDDSMVRQLYAEPPGGRVTVILDRNGDAAAASPWLVHGNAQLRVLQAHDGDDAIRLLEEELVRLRMGARLYVIGNEDMIWRATEKAEQAGMGPSEIQQCCIEAPARPVYCIHCLHTTSNVRTNVVSCGGCGRSLLVREHFSRRHGAYMGFQVDAEVPGELPEIEELTQ